MSQSKLCVACFKACQNLGEATALNIYRITFAAKCPADGETIIYKLEIRTPEMIYVEHLKTATALHGSGFHEAIADNLYARFGGAQVMAAVHQGVELVTLRGIK